MKGTGYKGSKGKAARESLLGGLVEQVEIGSDHKRRMTES